MKRDKSSVLSWMHEWYSDRQTGGTILVENLNNALTRASKMRYNKFHNVKGRQFDLIKWKLLIIIFSFSWKLSYSLRDSKFIKQSANQAIYIANTARQNNSTRPLTRASFLHLHVIFWHKRTKKKKKW